MPSASLHSECCARPWVRAIHNVWVVTERACDHRFDGGAAHFEGYDQTIGSSLRPTSPRLPIVGGVRRHGRRTVACRRAVSPIQGYSARASEHSWRSVMARHYHASHSTTVNASAHRRLLTAPYGFARTSRRATLLDRHVPRQR